MLRILFPLLLLLSSTFTFGQMNNETLGKIISQEVIEAEGRLGNWQALYGGRLLYIITDENADRMRIFTPVLEQDKLEDGQLEKMLEANFHAALDAKYSLYEGLVISVYTHPLGALQKDQFIDAMQQVVNLADTFGGSYSSTSVIFNPGGADSESETEPSEKKLNQKPAKQKGT